MASTVWAHVAGGSCDNIIVLDPATSNGYPMDGLVEIDGLDPMPGIGWRYDGSNWTAPPNPLLIADPSQIPNDGTTTSTVTYTWSGWPEDEPPASVDFTVNGGGPQTVDLTDGTATLSVTSADADQQGQINIQCVGLVALVTVEAA